MSFINRFFRKNSDRITAYDIENFINRGVEESVNLDYKHIDAIKNKKNLLKHVSAFANAKGGLLVLGVSERAGEEQMYPDKITWGGPAITKERLENLIKDNIDPPPEFLVVPIRKSHQDSSVIFLIDIPKSNTLHMTDHRFYRRVNFQSVPMDQREVVDFVRERISYDRCAMFRFQLEEFLLGFVGEMLYRLVPDFRDLDSRKEARKNIVSVIDSLIKTWDQTKITIMENTPIIQLIRFGDYASTIYTRQLDQISEYPHNEISPEEELLLSELKKLVDDLATPYLGLGGLRSFLLEDAKAHGKSSTSWTLTPLEFGIKVGHKDHVLDVVGVSLDLNDLLECILKLMKRLNDLKLKHGDFGDSQSVQYFYSDI